MESNLEHPREQSAAQIGAVAPDFTLPDENNRAHNLAAELRAGKPIILFFMRGEW
ncbi:MAG: redoxin domain-containing protein [Chloroflexi bacterium]|nr:redoxin domain-containing protein [Chloroflexota bacterium]